jgi:hypothetical protein
LQGTAKCFLSQARSADCFVARLRPGGSAEAPRNDNTVIGSKCKVQNANGKGQKRNNAECRL